MLSCLGLRIRVLDDLNARLALADANQRALEESEEKYRELIESTGAGYVIADGAGKIIECNDAYTKLVGRSSCEDVVGHNLLEWAGLTESDKFILNECSSTLMVS